MAAASLIAHLAFLQPGQARADSGTPPAQGASAGLVPCDSRLPASGYTGGVNLNGTPVTLSIPDGATRLDQILIGGPFRTVSYCEFIDVKERGVEDDALAEPMQVLVLQDLRQRPFSYYNVVAVQGTSAPPYDSTSSFAGSTLVIPARADDRTESYLVLHVDADGKLSQVIDPADRERQIQRYQAFLHPVASSTPAAEGAGSPESHAGSGQSQPETPLQAPQLVAYRITHYQDGTVRRQAVRPTDSGRFILAPGTYAFDYEGLDARLAASTIDIHGYSREDADTTSERGVEMTLTGDTTVVSTVVQDSDVVPNFSRTYPVTMLRTGVSMPVPVLPSAALPAVHRGELSATPPDRRRHDESLLDSSTFWGVVAGVAITGIGIGLCAAYCGGGDRSSSPYDIAGNNRGPGDR